MEACEVEGVPRGVLPAFMHEAVKPGCGLGRQVSGIVHLSLSLTVSFPTAFAAILSPEKLLKPDSSHHGILPPTGV